MIRRKPNIEIREVLAGWILDVFYFVAPDQMAKTFAEGIAKSAKKYAKMLEFEIMKENHPNCTHANKEIAEPHLCGARRCLDCGMYYNRNLGGWVDGIRGWDY